MSVGSHVALKYFTNTVFDPCQPHEGAERRNRYSGRAPHSSKPPYYRGERPNAPDNGRWRSALLSRHPAQPEGLLSKTLFRSRRASGPLNRVDPVPPSCPCR